MRQGYLSHLETFISRKLITRHVETLTQNKPNGSFNGKSALCVNFEDNLPDLGVVMSEIVLRHSGYNVYNTGSHADLGNLKTILVKKSVDLVLFYLSVFSSAMAMAAGAAPDAAGTPVKRRSVSDILKYSPEEGKLAVKQMQLQRTKALNGLKAVDKNYKFY